MKRFIEKYVSPTLIVLGCVCIVFAVVYELVSYPWSSLGDENINKAELPDPPRPEVPFIDYAELLAAGSTLPAQPEEIQVLPGDEEPDIASEPGTAAVPSHTNGTGPESSENSGDGGGHREVRIGLIKIPRIDVSQNIFEGTSNRQLGLGAGHGPGSAFPGESGNCVIAAHRVGNPQPFRYLDKLQNGDAVNIEFDNGAFTYEVFDAFIVDKSELWVMGIVPEEPYLLTLITCDPVVRIGPSRDSRLIVRARMVEPPLS